ncbi:MAG: YcaQ family DNA glycosylase [Xanthomonadales bacterium]|nr:YcaQ family DNA glycosylase [Xanthomonadales bacterium]
MTDQEFRLGLTQARRLQLYALGLLNRPPATATRPALLRALRQIQLLQIDTISVVARSPYLVLYSRLGAYPQDWLERALANGQIFETWAHEACFAPIDDLPWHRQRQRGRDGHWAMKHADRVCAKHPAELAALTEHIRAHGAVRSSDFPQPPRNSPGWWEWKPEKRWLEALFAKGELMISRREGFQRVYDLTSRVLARHRPGWDDAQLPGDDAAREWMIEQSVLALGVTVADWVADYYRLQKRVSDRELAALVDQRRLIRVQIADWDRPAYVHRQHAHALEQVIAGRLRATHTALLSPFDPLVWDRRRALELFDFHYKLECYTPAPKRQWGYFVLPLLDRGELIGRVDAKAHRADGVFELRDLHLEEHAPRAEHAFAAVAQTLRALSSWHQTPELVLGRIHCPHWEQGLTRALSG